jgi:hypothetical protein
MVFGHKHLDLASPHAQRHSNLDLLVAHVQG